MELKQIRYFLAAAELGNIGMAAKRLNTSQPPVTRTILALEQELGFDLFVRTPRGVRLTEAGIQFQSDAVRLLQETELSRERARDASLGKLGRFDVAFFGSIINHVVPGLLRRFCDDHPEIEVALTRMSHRDQTIAVRERRLHIGFGRYYGAERGIVTRTLAQEPLYAVARDDSELAAQTSVTMAELAANPVLLFPNRERPSFADQVIAAFQSQDLTLKIENFAEDNAAALALVSCGHAVSIVPNSVARQDHASLVFLPITDLDLTIPLSCTYLEASEDRAPVLERFLAYLDEVHAD